MPDHWERELDRETTRRGYRAMREEMEDAKELLTAAYDAVLAGDKPAAEKAINRATGAVERALEAL